MFRDQKKTADNDIGIVAPYHAQCLKIKAALRAVADGIQVGSVEQFQGQVCHVYRVDKEGL